MNTDDMKNIEEQAEEVIPAENELATDKEENQEEIKEVAETQQKEILAELDANNEELTSIADEANKDEDIELAEGELSENQAEESAQVIEEIDKSIQLEEVYQLLKEVDDKFTHKIATDAHKNQLFDKMYKELDSYKNDLYTKMLKPLVMDIIQFADNMGQLVGKYDAEPDAESIAGSYKKLLSEFLKIREHMDDILYNNGIESFESQEGDLFDSRNQKVKKSIPTEIEEDNKKIEKSILPGYTWDDKLLRREMVCVKILEK